MYLWEEKNADSASPFCMFCGHILSGQTREQIPITANLAVKKLLMACPKCAALCIYYHTPRFDRHVLTGSRYLTYWIPPPNNDRFTYNEKNRSIGLFNNNTIFEV